MEDAHSETCSRAVDILEAASPFMANRTPRRHHSSLLASLKSCAKRKDLETGINIHFRIIKAGLLKDNLYIGSSLINMYAKCGALARARQLFDELPDKNVVYFNALITGYVQNGYFDEALEIYDQIRCHDLVPNRVSFLCVLKACGNLKAVEKGKEIHARIVQEGLLRDDSVLGTTLVDMYAKCGLLAKAQEVFDQLPAHDVVSWTAIIVAYAQNGYSQEALNCFVKMDSEGFSPNEMTFSCALKACGSLGSIDEGKVIHAEILRKGFLENNLVLGNALIDMYAKYGELEKAREVLDGLQDRDVYTWTMLMEGYSERGHGLEAVKSFEWMKDEAVFPDPVTFVSMLKACGSNRLTRKGTEIHCYIRTLNLLNKNHDLGTALVDMYVKCGALAMARSMLDGLPKRDIVALTALISGYVHYGNVDEAFSCFEQLRNEGLSPDPVTFLCILKACSSIGASLKGTEIYSEMVREGVLATDSIMGTTLVDMYAKCGKLDKAHEVFDGLADRGIVSWTAIITGYSQIGKYDTVFYLFENMLAEGIQPDTIVFTAILNACSYSGMVGKGQMYFEAMSQNYGMLPTVEHYSCMVSLFSHAAHFGKAMDKIQQMPSSRFLPASFALLTACRKWGKLDMAVLALLHVLQSDNRPNNILTGSEAHEHLGIDETLKIRNMSWKQRADIPHASICVRCDALAKAYITLLSKLHFEIQSHVAYSKIDKHGKVSDIQSDNSKQYIVTFTVVLKAGSYWPDGFR